MKIFLLYMRNISFIFIIIIIIIIIIILAYFQKMRGYPEFSFLIPIALAKICFSRIVKLRKITSVLVGTVLNFHDN